MLASPLARSFYLAHWVLVTGIAYVAADMVDETIRTKLENISPPVRAGVSLIPKNHSLPSEEDLRLIVSRNPFSPESRGSKYLPGSFDLSDDTSSGKSASSGNGEVVPVGNWMNHHHLPLLRPSVVKLRLVGTLVASGTQGGAVIQSIGKEDQKFYHINQEIVPGKIALMAVRKDYVILRVDRQFGILKAKYNSLDDSGQKIVSGTGNTTLHGIRKIDDHHWLIESRAIRFAMKNMNTLMMQARAVPNMNAGHMDGFRLVAIQPGSLYQEVGLAPGDVIRSINGMSMSDPQNFVKALTTLGSVSQVQVNLVRNGVPQTFQYQIQ
ncbi:type II secretion system protein N [Leptospirillum ferriphilum]|jgi:general secretion pathway protein C|uniref:General secretion pathway protein GspC n=3 Tax=Leptospirillum ferriphilum TaxID=178606 RepID=A0A059XP27_9BACT|nr:type II secretion system protein N [Leptospirillum ferriphilum]AFS53202.1 putative general secretion pathway protein C [Leptospirillum ferriphilum ML-04]AIA30279.1 general secretion pathway protein GspC [Leptospirillum ferriphilum YSK]OOH75193.1 general secretion pathway protein GspC [Leptospirillum ferriphilum]OOH78819.1 general secretion pathway protein GspC [Leptospirillum ferriphilum]